MAALQSTEPIGTTARLGVLRLGAGRLGAVPRASQLKPGTGIYAWVRSDGAGGEVNRGQPPVAALGGWTTGRS
jgi:hypothetical protein